MPNLTFFLINITIHTQKNIHHRTKFPGQHFFHNVFLDGCKAIFIGLLLGGLTDNGNVKDMLIGRCDLFPCTNKTKIFMFSFIHFFNFKKYQSPESPVSEPFQLTIFHFLDIKTTHSTCGEMT